MSAPWEAFFEQWGRTVEYEFYTSTGSDEPEQHTQAVAIVDRRPFAVISVPGGIVLQTELAAARILVLGGATNTEGRTQSPYRWGSFATDLRGRRGEHRRVRGQVTRRQEGEVGG